MPALPGLGVLVTRPELQATPLCRLLEAQGANPIRLPAIEIRPFGTRDAIRASVEPLDKFDLIIFLSANAVRYGAPLLDQRRDLNLAAVGPATLRALNQAGYRVPIVPAERFDSEGLLAHPRLQNLTGQRVLTIRGSGGREILEQVLEQRGAAVTACAVYERLRSDPGEARLAELEQQLQDDVVHVIIATSLEIVESLLAMGSARPALLSAFSRPHWLVPSQRVAIGARALGLAAPLLVAASAEDQALVDALARWRSSVSGA
ncbi:MAG: uroporphyrinogen-III synthase [Steroidobacterales bacterium]